MQSKSPYNLAFRACAGFIAFVHLLTFGPMKEALAFSAQSQSYSLTAGALTQGGGAHPAQTLDISQDSIGEPCAGSASSDNYLLNSGFIATLQPAPPLLSKNIPFQSWQTGGSKQNAFDLDDYFSSPEGYPLTFTATSATNITISINPETHLVSFTSAAGWHGVEKVYFYATDSQGNTARSNEVTLQVDDPQAPDQPAIVDIVVDPLPLYEGNKAKLTVIARDPDGDPISFTYNSYFTETGREKIGGLWYSYAEWQIPANANGHYQINITASDGTLTSVNTIPLNVGNTNRAPVIQPIADVTATETDRIVISRNSQPTEGVVNIFVNATDPDNDPLQIYYYLPFDSSGIWQTNYDSEGIRPIKVIVSDGIDTTTATFNLTVQHKNVVPTAALSLDKYTVGKDEQIAVTLTGSDYDNDSLTYVLKKDGSEISSGAFNGSYVTSVSFPDLGSHNISATVSDGVGVAEASASVDVAETYTATPIMGDFNGDSLTDLGMHNSSNGKWEICLSNKGKFLAAREWISGLGDSLEWIPLGGDFNGDAQSDAAVYKYNSGELKVATSNGSKFDTASQWLQAGFSSASWQPFTGNFNGDRFTDFGLYNKDTGEIKIAFSSGHNFGDFGTWLNNNDKDYIALTGDFNGDSLTDLCLFKKSSGEFKVYFSNLTGFVDGKVWLSGFAQDKDATVSDFNNDGLTDVGYWDKSSGKWYYAISTGEGFVDKGVWLDSFGSDSDETVSTGDFDGNGLTDAAAFDREQLGINRWKVRLSTNKPSDLLNQIDNGIGGFTSIEYTFAAASVDNSLPFPVYVCSKVAITDTRPDTEANESYSQIFSYSGGYFDAAEREFRGFKTAKVTDPITGNYTVTEFYQGRGEEDGCLKAQVKQVSASDGNNLVVSRTDNTYEVKKAGPSERVLGFAVMVKQDITAWEENHQSLSAAQEFTYDSLGNVLSNSEQADILDAKKKITKATYQAPYEEGFNRPLVSQLEDQDGVIASQKNFEYDPRGNLTKETVWLDTSQVQPQTTYQYDDYGNLITTTNALGKSVRTEYETDFYTFPRKVINFLGHTVSYEYNQRLGLVTATTDPNGATTRSQYDSLGRPLSVQNALGQTTVTYEYPDFNTKITRQGQMSKTEYIDGLGRKYRSTSIGEDGNELCEVSAETYFNNRGLTDKESLPHKTGENEDQISYIRYAYDIRGRVTSTTSDFPGVINDATSQVQYAEPLYTVTIDPMGHRKGTRKDAWGNIRQVIEFADTEQTTSYEYDIKNNLVKTTDAAGNITQIHYDSLGRKTAMEDPDMGNWKYEYDILGNLIRQTDAKKQVIVFTYDALNRLKEKKAVAQSGDKIIATYVYDYVNFQNSVGRLCMVFDESGSTTFGYDKLGREISSSKQVDGTEYSVNREYDVYDRLVRLTYPDDKKVTYNYNETSGLLKSVPGFVENIIYKPNGQMSEISYTNGTKTQYDYGNDLRLSRLYTTTPGQSPQGVTAGFLQDLNYQFDYNGNLTTLTDNLRSNTRTFVYDKLDRLKEANNLPAPGGGYTDYFYRYNAIGNMIYKSDLGDMSYGNNAGPHALTLAAGIQYRYDANGNMVAGKNKTMEYDEQNRLTKVIEPQATTSFVYDGDGGRVKKGLSPQGTVPGLVTTYIGSLFEMDSDGKYRKHVFAGANRVCTVAEDSSKPGLDPDLTFYHTDHLGSTNITSDAQGNAKQYCEYTPYGTLTRGLSPEGTVPADATHYLFTGKELDTTGLYFYGARYYDPEIGRFITPDTIVQAPYDPQSLNRYTYCRNNPINYIDPSGHFWWFIPIIIGAIVGGAMAAITGGNIGLGILTGALSGALFAGAGGIVAGMHLQGLAAAGVFAGAGAISGAASAAISGGNIGIGALTGALGGAIGYGVSSIAGNNIVAGFLGSVAAGAAVGGLGSVLLGGGFGEGAWRGAASAAIGYTVAMIASNIKDNSSNSSSEVQEQVSASQPDNFQFSIDAGQAEGGAAGAISAGKFILSRVVGGTSTYYKQSWVEPYNKYAPLWKGAARVSNTLSTIQALGVVIDATGFIDIMQSVALRGVSIGKGEIAIGVHTVAMVTKILGAAGGTALGAALTGGNVIGAVAGGVIVGGGVSIFVNKIEGYIMKELGVK